MLLSEKEIDDFDHLYNLNSFSSATLKWSIAADNLSKDTQKKPLQNMESGISMI